MIRFAKNILSAGLGGLVASLLTVPAAAARPAALPSNLPLCFEAANQPATGTGQFIARGLDYQFLISPATARIALHQAGGEAALRMQFAGANPQAQIRGDTALPGKINYLTGNNPAQWRTGVAMFARVRVEELYPGISLVYYGNRQQLEYDFTIAPGADPGAIAIRFDGADKISINAQGELVVRLAGGEIRQPRPVIYQTIDGARKEIAGGYRLVDAHTIAFAIGKYDSGRPLVIDPVLNYSTYFGGDRRDIAWAVALDASGSVYFAGETLSKQIATNIPFASSNAFQTNFAGGIYTGDAFVCKFDPATGYPVYVTYLGGAGNEAATCLAVDNNGNAFVSGYTDSTNFPVSTNAIQRKISGVFRPSYGSYATDVFVTELDAAGTNIIYSTYLGGNAVDAAYGIAVDMADNAYIIGHTYSTNFPTTNAFQSKLACTNSVYFNANAFLAKIGPGGSSLDYSTYFGGNNFDRGQGIAVDTNGSVYITGCTASTNFPTTNAVVLQLVRTNSVGTNQVSVTNHWNGYQLNNSTNKTASYDAFVAKFDPTGTNLLYSTLLGSTNNDKALSIAVDITGAAYVTGWTVSSNFPNTLGTSVPGLYSYLATNTSSGGSATNVFLTKITNSIGTTNVGIAWSTLFGGRGMDIGNSVAVDPAGEVFVTGSASSTNFPIFNVPGYLRPTNSGKSDAFVIAFSADPTNLLYSTYLGGRDDDFGYGIAVATNGDAWVVGLTFSTNFPVLSGLYTKRNGSNDTFLTKIMMRLDKPEIVEQTGTNWVVSANSSEVVMGVTATGPPILTYHWQLDGTNVVADGTNIVSATNSQLQLHYAYMTNSGNYTVIITNYGGAVTSSVYSVLVTNILELTDQPTNQTVVVGTNVTFSINGHASSPFFFQWQKDGTNLVAGGRIHSVTNYYLTITNAQRSDTGDYQVIVTNFGGSVTSEVAHLEVTNFPPAILVQPTNQTVAVGSNAQFVVTAVGGTPLSYRWQKNGTNLNNGGNISGATSNVLTLKSLQTSYSSTNFMVIVSNYAGSVTSSMAALLVTDRPVITMPPTNQAVPVATTVRFTVTAVGTAPLKYYWRKDETNVLANGGRISGATTNMLIISNAQTNDIGSYSVLVSNAFGTATSPDASLKVTNIPPTIIVQPTNQTVAVSSNVTFAVTINANATTPVSYQWQINETNLVNGGRINSNGVTSATLTITNAQTTDSATNYRVIVTNPGGSVTSSIVALTVTAEPVIMVQPTSKTVNQGTTVTFAVSVVGTAPLSYQWQTNGIDLTDGGRISGATSATLTITNAQTTDNATNYRVVVSNIAGTTNSANAALTVLSAPVILVQPTDQGVAVGATATFTVAASGATPMHYQWQLYGQDLANATGNALTITNAQIDYSGSRFRVVVKNTFGAVTSSIAILTVTNVLPAITRQPVSRSAGANIGAAVTLSVIATGTAPLSYQWWLGGTTLLADATNNFLTFSNVQLTNDGSYSVVVTNVAGSVTSSPAVLTVTNVPPAIVVQPTNQIAGAESTVQLVVTATGTAPLSYQWQLGGTNLVDGGQIAGTTAKVLTISNAQTNNSGIYSVIVTNVVGSVTSSNAVLTVTDQPVITVQPTNQGVGLASTAQLVVIAVGIEPLSYQWQMSGTNLADGGQIAGATNNVLTISNAQTNNSGTYSVIVTNAVGSVTSSNAVLTVTDQPLILVQPTNQTAAAESTVRLVVIAVGIEPLSYQWRMNGTNLVNGDPLDGVTNNELTISNAQTNNSGTYSVIVTNVAGLVISSDAELKVTNVPPSITLQPTSQTVWVGTDVTFTTRGSGTSPFFFQWQRGGTNLVEGGRFLGTTNFTLNITGAQTNDAGDYQIVVMNYGGSATSDVAVLTVLLPPAFQSITAAGDGNFVLSGAGGMTNGAYYVLTTPDLLVPLTNWTLTTTGQFDSIGNFIFTNTAPTNTPQLFYLLQLP
jgi:hypothetical protein